jgi:hypothetical protein
MQRARDICASRDIPDDLRKSLLSTYSKEAVSKVLIDRSYTLLQRIAPSRLHDLRHNV